MIYATCLNESSEIVCNEYSIMDIISESVSTIVEFCLTEMELMDESHIDDKYRNPKKKTKFDLIKEMVLRLWESFKTWCKSTKQKLLDVVAKVKAKINIRVKQKKSSSSSDTTSSKPKVKTLVLNDKFNKIDESKLMRSEILNLSAALQNYDKELYENYNNTTYTESVVKDITNGEFSSIDDIKGKELVSESEISEDEANNINELNNLAKKYDSMISEVDNYFNRLQDSIKKAEAKFKGQIMPTEYSDDNVSAKSNNPLETRKLQFIINTSVKMIGAQSGVVRNIVYAKVDAISRVIEGRG